MFNASTKKQELLFGVPILDLFFLQRDTFSTEIYINIRDYFINVTTAGFQQKVK